MKKIRKKKYSVANNSIEIAKLIGIESKVEIALIENKANLSNLAVKAIADSKLSLNEIVKRSGVARSKVSAIKNGAIAGISSDLFIKVISAAGKKLQIKIAA